MFKKELLAIALVTTGICTAATVVVLKFIKKRTALVEQLIALRDDLKLDCDLLESATDESPEKATCAADQGYLNAVTEGILFVEASQPLFKELDCKILDMKIRDLQVYIESFEAAIRQAENYIITIDAARAEMEAAHEE